MSRVRARAAALLLAGAFAACSDAPTEVAGPEAEAPRIAAAEPTALMGIDAHFSELARDVPGFGGAYLDESGRTVVHLAGRDLSVDADRLRDGLRGRIPGRTGRGPEGPMAAATGQEIVLQEASWSYDQLIDFRRRASGTLGLPGAVYTDVDERTNRVAIGVTAGADQAAFRAELAASGVPAEAVRFAVTEPIAPLKGKSLTDRVQPFGGGLQLIYPHPTPGFVFLCSLGFNILGDYPGRSVNFFVTNSHCSSDRGVADGTPYFQQGLALPDVKNQIAQEVFDPPFFPCAYGPLCRVSDVAVAAYQTARTPVKHGVIHRPGSVNTGSVDIDPGKRWFTIAGEEPFPFLGDVLSKVGRTTGWTEGEVVATCADVGVAFTDIVLLCQDLVLAGVGGGDSGSPVFMRYGDSDQVTLYGILWGGGGPVFAFSAMANIHLEIGSFGVN